MLSHERDNGLSERADELDLIHEFLDRASLAGATLVLRGEPGVGKTALLNAASGMAAKVGMRVLRAGGVEFEASMPFSTLHQTLDPLQPEFAQLGRTHALALRVALGLGEGRPAKRRVVATASLALIRRAAAACPVLLVIDDLQWVDRASANVLGFIARQLHGSRIGFIGGTREVSRFFDGGGAPSRELLPLDRATADRFVGSRFPALASRSRRRVVTAARGNPLALLEFGEALTRSPEASPEVVAPVVLPQSRELQDLFASRIQELPGSVQRVLLLAALDGSGDLRVLGNGASSPSRDELVAAERARLVRVDETTTRLEFRHPLIRRAVVEVSTDHERRRAHAVLAELLHDDPDRRAWHLGEAASAPDEHVAILLERTADRSLRRGDAIAAVSALTRAARLSPAARDRGRRLALAAFIGADVTGALDTVSALLADAAITGAEPGAVLKAAAEAAHLLHTGDGDLDTAHALLVAAIEHHAAEDGAVNSELEAALWMLMRVCYFGERAELFKPLTRALARYGQSFPDLDACAKLTGDPVRTAADALPWLDAAIRGLVEETDPTRIVRIAIAGSFVDRSPDCREAMWRVVHDGRDGGADASALRALLMLARDDFWTGRWDEAQQLLDEAAGLCETHGYVFNKAFLHYVQALVAGGRGDSVATLSLTDEMLRWAAPRGARNLQCLAWHARALAALARADFEEAYREASKISPPGRLASHQTTVLSSALALVEAAARSGHRREAAAHAAALRQAKVGVISARLALVERAAAATAAPDAAAVSLFEQALATPAVDRWPFDVARVQLAFGERLRRIKATRQARLHLSAALQTFERLGAEPWSSRAANELRASGETRPPAGDRDRDALTPQEREIAELAAGGLTNKEIGQRLFLSHRTVSGHLHRLFPKLGITSRAALRDALASLPSLDRAGHPDSSQ